MPDSVIDRFAGGVPAALALANPGNPVGGLACIDSDRYMLQFRFSSTTSFW